MRSGRARRSRYHQPSYEGVVANVTSIEQTPNSELVQVKYNKIVPESMEGSLDTPEIRELLMVGTRSRRRTMCDETRWLC